MESKRVFILGAGSSIGHSKGRFPSINKFFSVSKKERFKLENYQQLSEYANKLIGKNVFDGRTSINIDDLFTHIEIEIERAPSWEMLAIRQQLLKLIRNVLIELQSVIENQIGEYNNFVKLLRNNDTIITFNWDLLLDNILNRKIILANRYHDNNISKEDSSGQYWEFIISLSALAEMTYKGIVFDNPYEEWKSNTGYYLKVHGSIDWFYCSNEACRGSRKVFPLLDPTTIHYCSECHEPLNSLLIPPVLNKGYRQYPLIRRIWNLAVKEISSADEIIIWGYSLPPTDFYSYWLLRQARGSKIKKLLVINPDVTTKYMNKMVVNRAFMKKFIDIFKGVLTYNQIFPYENFSEYANGEDILIKYALGDFEKAY